MKSVLYNERERHIATQRLARDCGTRDRAEFSTQQAMGALKSPMTWIHFLWALCLDPNHPIIKVIGNVPFRGILTHVLTLGNSTVINGFGYDEY